MLRGYSRAFDWLESRYTLKIKTLLNFSKTTFAHYVTRLRKRNRHNTLSTQLFIDFIIVTQIRGTQILLVEYGRPSPTQPI